MRFSPVIAATLPLLASAQQQQQQQQPLNAQVLQEKVFGWFNQAKSMVPPAVVDSFNNLKNAAAAGTQAAAVSVASQAAATSPIVSAKPAPPLKPKHVTEVNGENWQELFNPVQPGTTDPEKLEWLMLVTGGNKSCFGRCSQLNKAWEVCCLSNPSMGSNVLRITDEIHHRSPSLSSRQIPPPLLSQD